MRHYVKLIVQVLLVLAVLAVTMILPGCKSGPKFSDTVANKDWNLIEARDKSSDIIFNRSTLQTDGFGEIFTLRFDSERVNGIAAPNRYVAPYKQADKHALSIQPAAGTQMAPHNAPERLKEHDFFIYLQNTYKWEIIGGNLELFCKSGAGDEAVLIFAPGK
jgi:heat shock protein HslJ